MLMGNNWNPIDVPDNSYVILDTTGFSTNMTDVFIDVGGFNSKLKIVADNHYVYRLSIDGSNNLTIIDTFLPYCEATDCKCTLENCVFFWAQRPASLTLKNTTIYSLADNFINYDPGNYTLTFDSTTNMLSSSVSEGDTIVLRNFKSRSRTVNNYNNPMIINKPVNIISYDYATYNADITCIWF